MMAKKTAIYHLTIIIIILCQLFVPGWSIQTGASIQGDLANGICQQRRDFLTTRVLQKPLTKMRPAYDFNNPLLCLVFNGGDGEFDATVCKEHVDLKAISAKTVQGRIHQGYNALLGQFPWMVCLANHVKDGGVEVLIPFCGGSFLGDKWVLTAAHCLNEGKIADARAVLGAIFINQDTTPSRQVINVKAYYKHPHYKEQGLLNDIALVALTKFPTHSKYVRNVKVHEANFDRADSTRAAASLVVLGWGQISEVGYGSNVLRYVFRTITSNSNCQSLLAGQFQLEENMLCTVVTTSGSNACNGDFGSPAAFLAGGQDTYQVVGVLSKYFGRCDDTTTEINADATKHIDFIEETMRKH